MNEPSVSLRPTFLLQFSLTEPYCLLPGAINELIATVTDTHRLTKADRYGMMAAILDESISEEERDSLRNANEQSI